MLLRLSGLLLGGLAAACLGWELADFFRSGTYRVASVPDLLTGIAATGWANFGPLLLSETDMHPAAWLLLRLPAWMLFGCPATILLWAASARRARRRHRQGAVAELSVPTPDES